MNDSVSFVPSGGGPVFRSGAGRLISLSVVLVFVLLALGFLVARLIAPKRLKTDSEWELGV